MNLTTEQELADTVLKLPIAKVAELRRKHQWPHVRLGRYDVRFTDDQVAQIVQMHTATPTTSPAVRALPGQTARSARRSR